MPGFKLCYSRIQVFRLQKPSGEAGGTTSNRQDAFFSLWFCHFKSCLHPRREITEAVTKRFRPDPLLGWPYFRSASCSCSGDPVALVFGTCPPPAGGDHWQPAPTQREPGSLPGWYFDILTVNTPSRWHSVQLVRDVNEVPQKECRKNNLMRGMTANPEKGREKTRRPALFLLHPLAPSLWPPQYVLVLLKVGR